VERSCRARLSSLSRNPLLAFFERRWWWASGRGRKAEQTPWASALQWNLYVSL
jgi:hypothetical protein